MTGFLVGTDPGLRQTRTPTVDVLTDGVGYTSGSSTTITLTDDPGSENHVVITFDGVVQHHDTYSQSGAVITFDAAIPSGVAKIEAIFAVTVASVTVPDASVSVGKLATTGTPNGTLFLRDDMAWTAVASTIVQVVNVMDGAVSTTTTVFPDDDTIPQITEGGEFMTLAITPTSATNKLLIQVVGNGAPDGDSDYTSIALFQDATAGALAAQHFNEHGGGARDTFFVFNHYMTAGTTSSTTFRVRMGQHSSGTFTFNGHASGRWFGGVMASSITITEISV